MSLLTQDGKGPSDKDLQNPHDSGALHGALETEKAAILDTLKGLDRDTLIALLSEVLNGKGERQ